MSFCKPRARKQMLLNSPTKPSRSASPLRAADFHLVPLEPIHLPQCRRARNTGSLYVAPLEPLLTLPGHRQYTQLQQLRHSQRRNTMDGVLDVFEDGSGNQGLASEIHHTYGKEYHDLQQQRRARKHKRQWTKWMHSVILFLISVYLQLLRETASLCNEPVMQSGCVCASFAQSLKIICVYFNHEFLCIIFVICAEISSRHRNSHNPCL